VQEVFGVGVEERVLWDCGVVVGNVRAEEVRGGGDEVVAVAWVEEVPG
jgi:hypothetical protein